VQRPRASSRCSKPPRTGDCNTEHCPMPSWTPRPAGDRERIELGPAPAFVVPVETRRADIVEESARGQSRSWRRLSSPALTRPVIQRSALGVEGERSPSRVIGRPSLESVRRDGPEREACEPAIGPEQSFAPSSGHRPGCSRAHDPSPASHTRERLPRLVKLDSAPTDVTIQARRPQAGAMPRDPPGHEFTMHQPPLLA